jgi:hypothetical protein
MAVVENLLSSFVLVSSQVRPLAGGTVEGISFYEHIATVYDQPANRFFVAYQTARVPVAFKALWSAAESLRDRRGRELKIRIANKQTRKVYIDRMMRRPGHVGGILCVNDWLQAIEDDTEFGAVAGFLIQHQIIDRRVIAKRQLRKVG